MDNDFYDVVVIGGGHAGCEAAAAAGRMGSKVLLITMNLTTIAQMSCNPAMGGVAKGQIIREIDALGGESALVTDKTTIQFRMLNRSKGPAMWSPRSQNDRMAFAATWRTSLENISNVDFLQTTVHHLLITDNRIVGIKTASGRSIHSHTVILTTGTFLNGIIHVGKQNYSGGRAGEKATTGITHQLQKLGFKTGRMKTGTPPRIDGRSLNYTKMEEQLGDENPAQFSFADTPPLTHQKKCWIAHTNKNVHHELEKGFNESPLFQGRIQGNSPRYCPSIEDKITRFADRDRHQLFIEPEGWNTIEIYLNGFSTSLPENIQHQALKKIPGFENVKLFRAGYAIEYDYFPPFQLQLTLETQQIAGLYFAGQINGTTGYEEAACQGLMAGINAHRKTHGEAPFILKRSEAYIGVLIDDLINKNINEPYRMFTSRAEYRILLRQDNADLRLTEIGHKIGLATDERAKRMQQKRKKIEALTKLLINTTILPLDTNVTLEKIKSSPIHERTSLGKLIKRSEINIECLGKICPAIDDILKKTANVVKEQVEIQLKYSEYLAREHKMVEKMKSLEDFKIHLNFDYQKVKALSAEAREKLMKIRPHTIGQASRISGVSPADLSVLTIYIGR